MAKPAKKKGGRPKKLDLTKGDKLCSLLSAYWIRSIAARYSDGSAQALLDTVQEEERFRRKLQQRVRHQLAEAASTSPDVAMILSRPSVTKVTTFDD